MLGSTRRGRVGESVARWVVQNAPRRQGVSVELVDLAEFDLPLLTEPTVPGAANREYETPQTRRWSEAIDSYDAFLWVSPEYNHGVPGAMKNAFDVLYPEWSHKAFGLVTYGSTGGIRVGEQWRLIIANALGVAVRHQLAFFSFLEWEDGRFTPLGRRGDELADLIDQLIEVTRALKPLRR